VWILLYLTSKSIVGKASVLCDSDFPLGVNEQVPLLLKIKLVSVKGTCRVCLRAPPSDRIWFSFKEMPNIKFAPEPIIGDHRISSGPLGSFIANQIKVPFGFTVCYS